MSRCIIIVQPALPSYRVDFFKRIAQDLGSDFCVYYSPSSDLGVLTETKVEHRWAKPLGAIWSPFPGAEWQNGALAFPVKRGDVIVVSGAPRYLTTLLLLIKAKLRGAETIWWGHYWSSTSKKYRVWIRMVLMRLSDGVLFYTDKEVEEYQKSKRRLDNRPIGALNNGINTDPIVALRSPYRSQTRSQSVLYIGRLTKKAEINVLLNAFATECLKDAILHIVGDGPEDVALRSLADELNVTSRVVWHGGTTEESQIAEVANHCRLFVYPGGVGLSLIHAMAYGLPAIVHEDRWRQMPEFSAFVSEKTGRTFCKGDYQDLSQKLSLTLNDEPALDRMSANSICRVSTDFNTEQMASRFLSFLNNSIFESGTANE